MKKDATVQVRVSSATKSAAIAILQKLGLSASQAVDIFLRKIIAKKGLPFNLSLEKNDRDENYREIKNSADLRKTLNV